MGLVRIQLIGRPEDVSAVMASIATAVPVSSQSPQKPSRDRADHVLVYARTRVGEEGSGEDGGES